MNWLTASVGAARLWFCVCACTYCCASSMLSHIAISWSILCLNDIYMDFRVVLHCKVPTPPPQVTLQLPQEPHAAQVASTAEDEFSFFQLTLQCDLMKRENNRHYKHVLFERNYKTPKIQWDGISTYGILGYCMLVIPSLRLCRLLCCHHVGPRCSL